MTRRSSLAVVAVVAVIAAVAVVVFMHNRGPSEAQKAKADLRLRLSANFHDVGVERVGPWHRSGDILSAWVQYKGVVHCASVDLSQRIDNNDDIDLAVQVATGTCKGRRPNPTG